MKIIQFLAVAAVFAIASLTLVTGIAQAQADKGKSSNTKADTSKDFTDGEVRKVDKDAGKLTIKHGEVRNLGMPAMTMVYLVKDKAMLDKVQAGDKIQFKAVSVDGKVVVTEIQQVK